jgi:triosephosphate isomerase
MAQPKAHPLIAGNWKMFKTTTEAEAFTEALFQKVQAIPAQARPDITLCPPFTALSRVLDTVKRLNAPFNVGAQTMESRESGAYTGEISPLMLKDLHVDTVILGHSERRQYYNETDETVQAKTQAALKHGLQPIVCVGESLQERESGVTDSVIERQVKKAIEGLSAQEVLQLVFAYEPVWAIGTGKTCDAAEANRVCHLIRQHLATTAKDPASVAGVRILYGGSVKPDNAEELMRQSDINGALVGGASLEAEPFFQIIQAAGVAASVSA